ncbi:MAG: VTT domain-containing protein, partial [Candidatus Methanomethyliaceae archaeon]
MHEFILSYGYFGTFIISVLGNLVPFLPVPYLIPIFLLSEVLEPFFVGITVGIGASLGKCVSYAIGRGGRAVLDEKKKKELECFGNLLGKYGAIAVYLFASLPLPDDIIVMPFGIIKYNFKRFFLALLLGKLTLGMIVAYTARYSFEYAKIFIGNGDPLPTIVVSVVFMLIMTWIIYKIDWIEA